MPNSYSIPQIKVRMGLDDHSAHAIPPLSIYAMATVTATTISPAASTPGSVPSAMPAQMAAPFTSMSQPSTQTGAASKTVGGPTPEVVCPLLNLDGTSCRKKCSGTFAYRSICEHIRRAHPENWIPRLPASAESFRRMIEVTPAQNSAAGMPNLVQRQAPPITENSNKKSSGGNGISKTRGRAQSRPKTVDIAANSSPASPAPSPDALASLPVNISYKGGLYDKNFELTASGQVSETDTESDGTRSPVSLPIPRVLQAHHPARKPTKSKGSIAMGISRRKSSILTKSPRRDRRRLEKTGKHCNSSTYSTPVRSSTDLKSMVSNSDMMDLDDKYKHRECESEANVASTEIGTLFGCFNRPRQSDENIVPSPGLRRAYSFSVGDNGYTEHVGSKKIGLALDTNISNRPGFETGPMSAGGIFGERRRAEAASRWEELIQAATEAGQAETCPLLYQPISGPRTSLANSSTASSQYNSRNSSLSTASTPRSPFGPELPASLVAMMDLAEKERRAKEAAEQSQFQHPYQAKLHVHSDHQEGESHYFQTIHPYSVTSHHHIPVSAQPYEYLQYQQGNFIRSYPPMPTMDAKIANHTNISPILRGTTLASATSSPPFTTLNSPILSPKVQCSLCYAHVDLAMTLACSECINGFCYKCVGHDNEYGARDCSFGNKDHKQVGEDGNVLTAGKQENDFRMNLYGNARRNTCGICGAQGPRFRPVRINVVAV